VPEDRTTAFCWFEKSASLGNDYATYRVGVCYELGLGVKQNVPKALQAYYDLATIFSYSHGAWALSEIYEHGRCGVPVDEEKARKWYRVFEDLRADEEASEEESDSDEEPETQTN
jgi:TPR repeat protein